MIQRTLRYMGLAPRKREDQVVGADLVFVAQDIAELIRELSNIQGQIVVITASSVTSVTDDGSGVVVVDNTVPSTPVIQFAGVNVDGVTITGDGTGGNPLVAVAGGGSSGLHDNLMLMGG